MNEFSSDTRNVASSATSAAVPSRPSDACDRYSPIAVLRQHLREPAVEQARREQVHLDVVAADLARERLGHPAQRRLRGRVVHRAPRSRAPLANEPMLRMWPARARIIERSTARDEQVRALDVDVHHLIPVRLLEERDRQDLRDARVVDEHVDAAPRGRRASATVALTCAASATEPWNTQRLAAERDRALAFAASASSVVGAST